MTDYKFNFKELLKGPLRPSNYAKTIVFIVCGAVLIGLIFAIINTISDFLPKKKLPATSTTTVGTVETGGVSTITNINYPLPDLKQGIYIRGASDRASIGVFKEVMPNIDVSIGGGKDYEDKEFIEIEARYKF